MKKVIFAFAVAFLIIATCMIYLVRHGVSLRTEPIIKPSPIDAEYKNISYAIVHRLFRELNENDILVWGLDASKKEHLDILTATQAEYEQKSQKKVTLLQANSDQLCPKPCWLLSEVNQAGEQARMLTAAGRTSAALMMLPFTLQAEVSPKCETEKRLEFDCIMPVSVREVRRKIKDHTKRLFFMRRYEEKDHYLFLQEM